MFTPKAAAYFGLCTVLLTLALTFQDWQLAALILPIASVFFLSNLSGLPENVRVILNRNVEPSESFGEEDVRVELHLENRSGARIGNLEIHDVLPANVKPDKGSNSVHVALDANANEKLVYKFPSPPRGHTPVGPLLVRARDPLGLYMVEEKLDPDTVAVLPRPEKVRGTEFRPRHLGPWPGTIPSRSTGHGSEFYSLRAYSSADDPKRINWKATARYGRLVLNETESERVTDVMIVLDTDVAFYESSERELFERGVRAAASMASLLLRQGNRVGLVLQGIERGIVRPGFGKRQERRILYMLAAARPGSSVLPTGYVVSQLARLLLPSRAQVVLVSSLLDSEVAFGIEQLTVDGYSVMVVTPTPTLPADYESQSEKLAFKILMLERENLLLRLERFCTLVQWPEDVPLSSRLRTAKVRRIRQLAR